jgi:hypothetical protein
LGQPMAFPACPMITDRGTTKVDFDRWIKDPVTCAETAQPGMSGLVSFPLKFKLTEVPTWLNGGAPRDVDDPRFFNLMVLNGTVEALQVSTDGLYVQDVVMGKLKAKYGDPTDMKVSKTSTLVDGKFVTGEFNRFTARWEFSDLHVVYTSVTGRITSGRIDITTAKFRAAVAAVLQGAPQSEERQL